MSYRQLNLVEIDLEALVHNLRVLTSRLASASVGLLAVVKSDAYGHGLLEVSRTLVSAGVWGLGISEIEEAREIRRAGIASPVVLLSGLYPGGEKEVFDLDLIPGVTDRRTLETLESEGARRGSIRKIHVKLDSGMGRLGLGQEEFLDCVARRDSWPHLEFDGLFSHLSSADEPRDPLNEIQIHRCEAVIGEIRRLGWAPRVVHVANSAGLLHFPASHFDLVRPGIALYGAYPGEESRNLVSLRPVMRFRSKVIAVRCLPCGCPVGYGHAYSTVRDSRIAVIPVGYDDGYLRSLSNRARVLIRGRRCPVVGRICMKALMADVSDLSDVQPGEEVVLLGRQGEETITVEDLARWGDTVNYEVLCLLGSRNERRFLGG